MIRSPKTFESTNPNKHTCIKETHRRSTMDTAPSPEKAHQYDSNVTEKGCMTIPKEAAHTL
jgi:hypothetical protein